MALVELLEIIGLPGSLMIVASAGIALYHGHHIMRFVAATGTYLRVAGLLGFLLVIAFAGLIPGVEFDVAPDVVANVLGGIWETAAGLVGSAV